MSAGIHKVNLSLHSFEESTEEDYLRYVGGLAEFSKKAAEQGTIVVFRLWNKGFDGGKNAVALNGLTPKLKLKEQSSFVMVCPAICVRILMEKGFLVNIYRIRN